MTPEDVKRLQMIEATYPLLDAWSARGQGQPEAPKYGSELQGDDKIWPKHPISELARTSLLLVAEHLRLIRVVLDVRQLFPSAPLTTLRGALVGAAQAVWILSPNERETRQVRGLTKRA